MRMGGSSPAAVPLLSGLLAVMAGPASAQLAGGDVSGSMASVVTTAGVSPELPFSPGERLEYAVTIARLRLGHGSLAVEAAERVKGVPTYRVALEVEISAPFLHFRDREVSWVAVDSLRSMAFERYRLEGAREERMRFRFDHAASVWDSEVWDPERDGFRPATGPGTSGRMPAGAIDEIAVLYLLRTLALDPGAVYRIDRYFDTVGNPMVFRVVGREKVRVPAGRFETVVVEPHIPALNPFQASRRPRIYVTDDARRLLVKITTRTKVGTLTFYLKDLPAGS
jgi:hypothetical protein